MDGVQPPPVPPHDDPPPNGPPEPRWRDEFDTNKRMVFAQHMLQKLFGTFHFIPSSRPMPFLPLTIESLLFLLI